MSPQTTPKCPVAHMLTPSPSTTQGVQPEPLPSISDIEGSHDGTKVLSTSPLRNSFLPESLMGWDLLCSEDGDGSLVRSIVRFFIADLVREDLSHLLPDQAPRGGDETPLALATAATHPLSWEDLMSASVVCWALARGVDSAFSALLEPRGGVSCRPSTRLMATRPGLGVFTAHPERRIRAYTACESLGRLILERLYGSLVFCVRYRGIRRGRKLFPASVSELGDACGGVGNWPLQLHTYFKMRASTTFERLMLVYAERSHLPPPWLTFEIADRLYGALSSGRAGRNGAATSSTSTNDGCQPLLPHGGRIRPRHSLWTLGMESRDGDLAGRSEEGGAQSDEASDPEGDSAQDIWVDSYLTCAEDECFVCVRDRRNGCEDPEHTPAALLPRFNRNCLEGTVMGTRGALTGFDRRVSGPYGAAGRFEANDDNSDLPSLTRHDDPGQPVRPPFPGWLFRLKVTQPLTPTLCRVLGELNCVASMGKTDENVNPLVLPSNSLRFVAVAPPAVCGGRSREEQRVPFELWRTDTAVEATTRAVLGATGDRPLAAEAVSKRVAMLPVHVIELHDESPLR